MRSDCAYGVRAMHARCRDGFGPSGAGGCQGRGDPFGRIGRIFMLPDPHNSPTGLLQPRRRVAVACDVPLDLGGPVPLVCLGSTTMIATAMPETAVNEHSEACPCEDEVNGPARMTRHDSETHPVAKAAAVQLAAKAHLRGCVTTRRTLHPSAHRRV